MNSTISLKRTGMIIITMLITFQVQADAWDNTILELNFLNSLSPIDIKPINIPIIIDEGEIECLAKNIYFEAGYEPYIGKLAVAQVTRNRVESELFPNSYCDVVWQKTKSNSTGKFVPQFSWTLDGKPDIPRNIIAYEQAMELAKEVLLYGKECAIIGQDVYNYHAVYVKPNWSKRMRRVAKIGNHLFYKRTNYKE